MFSFLEKNPFFFTVAFFVGFFYCWARGGNPGLCEESSTY